jgi:hypothetical protein
MTRYPRAQAIRASRQDHLRVRIERIRKRKALYARLRQDLLLPANFLLTLFNKDSPVVVEPRKADAAFSAATRGLYDELNAAMYTIWPRDFLGVGRIQGTRMMEGKMTVESDPVKLGAVTYCHCMDSVYVLWDWMTKRYAGMF